MILMLSNLIEIKEHQCCQLKSKSNWTSSLMTSILTWDSKSILTKMKMNLGFLIQINQCWKFNRLMLLKTKTKTNQRIKNTFQVINKFQMHFLFLKLQNSTLWPPKRRKEMRQFRQQESKCLMNILQMTTNQIRKI